MSSLSVLLPNFNHARYIAGALKAIGEQSFSPDEIIVVDDGSTDDSVAVIERYMAEDPRIRLLKNGTNKGMLFSMQKAFEASRGEYVYLGASDDRVFPGFFKKAMALAECYPQAGVIFGQVSVVDPSGGEVSVIKVSSWAEARYASPETFLKEYLEKETPLHSLSGAALYRKKAVEGFGPLCFAELGHWSDTFRLRGIALKYGACYIPEPCLGWNVLPESVSQNALNDPPLMLRVIAEASKLMRSERYGKFFPEAYVSAWEKKAKKEVLFLSHPAVRLGMKWYLGKSCRPIKKLARLMEPAIRNWIRS